MRCVTSTVVWMGVLVTAAFGCGRPDASTVATTTTPSDTVASRPSSDQRAVVLCLGDSLTAGYGLTPAEAYPAILQQFVDEQGWPFRVVNAGLSGVTTSAGLRRLDWLMNQGNNKGDKQGINKGNNRGTIDVLILARGGNDGLRGIDLDTVESNLVGIIGRARELRPDIDIVLAGIQPPPNMGPDYTEGFKRLYPDLARSEGTALIPFLLEDVGGVEALNQADGVHPTAEGQKLLARNVWSVLEPVLAKRVEAGDS